MKANVKHKNYDFQVGQLAWKKGKLTAADKVRSTLLRPYRIEQVHTNGTVTLRLTQHVRERTNIRRIAPYGSNNSNDAPQIVLEVCHEYTFEREFEAIQFGANASVLLLWGFGGPLGYLPPQGRGPWAGNFHFWPSYLCGVQKHLKLLKIGHFWQNLDIFGKLPERPSARCLRFESSRSTLFAAVGSDTLTAGS